MQSRVLLLPSIAFACACASAQQTAQNVDRVTTEEVVEIVVRNRFTRDLELFVWWEGASSRVPLGDIRAGATETFGVRPRSRALILLAHTRASGTSSRDDIPVSYVDVRPGDRVEVTVRGQRSMSYRVNGLAR